MNDLRMLHMLQEIRRFAVEELHGKESERLFRICRRAIELDSQIHAERLREELESLSSPTMPRAR